MPFSPSTARSSRLPGLIMKVIFAILLAAFAIFVSDSAAGQPGAGAGPSREGRWVWPIDGEQRIIRPFVAPKTVYSAGHRGIDIEAPVGRLVISPDAGVVHFAGIVVDRPVISIRHPDGIISSFEPVTSDLIEGAAVARGSPIGTVESGHCTTGCLHLGVRLHGEYVSPLRYLDGIRRAVLLPTRDG